MSDNIRKHQTALENIENVRKRQKTSESTGEHQEMSENVREHKFQHILTVGDKKPGNAPDDVIPS